MPNFDTLYVFMAKEELIFLYSSLENIEAEYLRRYAYELSDSENSISFILPSAVNDYAFLPFLIMIASNVAVINVTGTTIGSSLSTNGVTTTVIVGTGITAEAIKENGKLRIKCRSSQKEAPISIIPIRKGITIESAYTSYTP